MSVAALDSLATDRRTMPAHLLANRAMPAEFSAMLEASRDAGEAPAAAATAQDDAREAARQFVATAMIAPLLAEIRESPLQSDFLDGGQAEAIFQQRFDEIVADRIVERMDTPVIDPVSGQRTTQLGIVDSIYRSVMRQQAQAAEAASGKVDVHG